MNKSQLKVNKRRALNQNTWRSLYKLYISRLTFNKRKIWSNQWLRMTHYYLAVACRPSPVPQHKMGVQNYSLEPSHDSVKTWGVLLFYKIDNCQPFDVYEHSDYIKPKITIVIKAAIWLKKTNRDYSHG